MRPNKSSYSYARDVVEFYAKYDSSNDEYFLKVDKLPEPDVYELCALIMQENRDMSSEALGPDNPMFERSILPSLLCYMKNSTDKDNEIEFLRSIKDSVVHYFSSKMQNIIDQNCIEKEI